MWSKNLFITFSKFELDELSVFAQKEPQYNASEQILELESESQWMGSSPSLPFPAVHCAEHSAPHASV